MAKLIVVKEHLPERCEICHQTDMFKADIGYCQRCNPNTISIKPSNLVPTSNNSSNQSLVKILLAIPAIALLPVIIYFIFLSFEILLNILKIVYILASFYPLTTIIIIFSLIFIVLNSNSKLKRKT